MENKQYTADELVEASKVLSELRNILLVVRSDDGVKAVDIALDAINLAQDKMIKP